MPIADLTPEMRALLLSAPTEVVNQLAVEEDRAIRAEAQLAAVRRTADALHADVATLRAENEELRVTLREISINIEHALTRVLVKAAG